MGKMMNFLTILIFIDLVFLITGQVTQTINSSLLEAVLSPESVGLGTFVKELFGNLLDLTSSPTGILSLIIGAAGVATGFIFTPTDTKLFVPVAATLGVLGGDFIGIYTYLSSLSKILALFILSPIMVLYYFTVVEWLRGKD